MPGLVCHQLKKRRDCFPADQYAWWECGSQADNAITHQTGGYGHCQPEQQMAPDQDLAFKQSLVDAKYASEYKPREQQQIEITNECKCDCKQQINSRERLCQRLALRANYSKDWFFPSCIWKGKEFQCRVHCDRWSHHETSIDTCLKRSEIAITILAC